MFHVTILNLQYGHLPQERVYEAYNLRCEGTFYQIFQAGKNQTVKSPLKPKADIKYCVNMASLAWGKDRENRHGVEKVV